MTVTLPLSPTELHYLQDVVNESIEMSSHSDEMQRALKRIRRKIHARTGAPLPRPGEFWVPSDIGIFARRLEERRQKGGCYVKRAPVMSPAAGCSGTTTLTC
jgi:hypothetical protein